MPEIAQHGHCNLCGRVVKHGKAACSEECTSQMERMQKSRKRTMMIMYGLLIVVVVFFFIVPLFFQGGGG